jgi:replicative DNA helicase
MSEQKILKTLLAELEGADPSNQGFIQLSVDDLPPDPFLRAYYRIIQDFWNRGLTPERSHIENMLAVTPGLTDVSAQMDDLLSYRTQFPSPRNAFAAWRYFADIAMLDNFGEEFLRLIRNPGEKSVAEIIQVGLVGLSNMQPLGNIRVVNMAGASKLLEERQNRLYRRYMDGKPLAPEFPFKGLNAMNLMYPGNPVLITAATKAGKSMLAQVLGEFFAWNGYHVMSLEQETSLDQFAQRRMARNLGIPLAAFIQPVTIDGVEQPPCSRESHYWQRVWSKWDQVLAERSKRGMFIHVNTSGVTMAEAAKLIRAQHEQAKRNDTELIVINDYLQKTIGDDDERQRLARIAGQWKALADQLQIYSIVMSQETTTMDGEIHPFGSREAGRQFQAHISLQRKAAVGEEPIQAYVNGRMEHLRDGMGARRYAARRAGQPSGKAVLKVLLNNNGPVGDVPVEVEPSYMNIIDEDADYPTYELLVERKPKQ